MVRAKEEKFVKLELYGVVQAEKKEFKGLKIYGSVYGPTPSLFFSKEAARDYVTNLIKRIKHEQIIGLRTKNNLIPEESLDFCIQPMVILIDKRFGEKRGWKFLQ